VAAMTRTSTRTGGTAHAVELVLLQDPEQLHLGFRGRSPISSRKMVPPSASSKRPNRLAMAPLKAPFSWPNSSLSTNPAGKAAQLTLMSGLSLRLLVEWMARAISSLPVPVSPVTSTEASVGRRS